MGDSVPSIVCDSLNQINSDKRFALVKLSHHGSRKNTNDNLFEYLQSNYFVVSTNGDRFNHPDKECLARIANYYEDEIIFAYNYNSILDEKIFSVEELSKYKIKEIMIKNPINILKI